MTFNIIDKIMAAATNLLGLKTKTPPPYIYGRQESSGKERTSGTRLSITALYSLIKIFFSSFYGFLLNCNNQENKQQFKDIQLQLHSSTVNNPYTFSIQGNRSFSSSCAVNLPASDTLLIRSRDYRSNVYITIPAGVKVIKVITYSRSDTEENCGSSASVYNVGSNKNWGYSMVNEYGSDSSEKYIGVTAGKKYMLFVNTEVDMDGDAYVDIYYCSSINNHSIDVADY